MAHPFIDKYLLVEAPFRDDPERLESPTGVFRSKRAAEEYVRIDAENAFCMEGDDARRVENWGSPFYLCKIVKVFKPVPVINIKVQLSKVGDP